MIRRCKTILDKCGKCGYVFKKEEKECPQCKTERKCNYRFKKDEIKCPICGAERIRCKKPKKTGSERCDAHTFASPQDIVEVGEKDFQEYDPRNPDRKTMVVGTIMDLDYELKKYQSMLSQLEAMVDKTDPKELSKYIYQANKYWKDVLATYYTIIDRKQVIERIPADLDAKIKEIISGTDQKATIACIDAFIGAMLKNKISDESVHAVITSLPQAMQDIYNKKTVNASG